MTLPWLRKKIGGATPNVSKIIAKADGAMEENEDKDDQEGLNAAASDLITAIKADNASGVAKALKSAFELCDSYSDEGIDVDGEVK